MTFDSDRRQPSHIAIVSPDYSLRSLEFLTTTQNEDLNFDYKEEGDESKFMRKRTPGSFYLSSMSRRRRKEFDNSTQANASSQKLDYPSVEIETAARALHCISCYTGGELNSPDLFEGVCTLLENTTRSNSTISDTEQCHRNHAGTSETHHRNIAKSFREHDAEQGFSINMNSDEDSKSLNSLHQYVRKECLEYFEASLFDVKVTRKGRHAPISVGRVGLRCKFCGTAKPSERSSGYAQFPSSIENIYLSVTTWQRVHFMECKKVTESMKKKYLALKADQTRGRRAYWSESAKNTGLIDTEDGIRLDFPKSK